MKEKYMKPALVMERFEMTQSIAYCGVVSGTLGDPNRWDKHSCGWDMGSMVVWTEENKGCDFAADAEAEFEGICYNNPNGGQSIFGS